VILETAGLILLVVVAAFLLTPLIRAALRQRAMDRWPRVTGYVVQRELPLTLIATVATTILVGFIAATVRILFLP